jgi:uncharacterized protein (TIGR00730 family)
LGAALAASEIRVVYGGIKTGLMSSLVEAALARGGCVTGVVPEFFFAQGLASEDLPDLRIVRSMEERKSTMLDLSDAVIMLPGGVGTQDEFWEALVGAQLGFHKKPCGVLNVNGYYDALLAFIDRALAEGFMSAADRENILVSRCPERLIADLSDRVEAFVQGAGKEQ